MRLTESNFDITQDNTELDVSRLYQEAQTLFEQQKYHQADEIITLLIKKVPENGNYFYLMAKIKERRGLFQEQIKFLSLALEIRPNASDILIQLAFAYLHAGDFQKAYQYANLTEKGLNDTDTYCLNAELFNRLGKYEKAVEVLEKAVLLNNNDATLFCRLGEALISCGKIKSAIQAFQTSLRLNPNSGLTYSALSKARKASNEDNHIEQLSLLTETDRNPWTAINIHHGLANELDELGRYQEAFTTLTRGKKRLRSVCVHNPFRGAENIKALQRLYASKEQEIQTNLSGCESSPIFVTGMPRSGTTIVERILTNHKEVVTVGERVQLSVLLKQQCSSAYAGLVDANVLNECWSTINFEKLGHDYVESVSYFTNKQARFVDKLPLNILMAGVILRALPNAKVVCLLRDPLDTIIGNYRQVFEQATGTYAYSLDLNALANFVYEFRQLVNYLQQAFPKRFIVVNYEKLVISPVKHGQRLFEFCQLAWDDAYLAIDKNTAPIGTASAAQVQSPIHQKALGHSRHYQFCLTEIKQAFERTQGDYK